MYSPDSEKFLSSIYHIGEVYMGNGRSGYNKNIIVKNTLLTESEHSINSINRKWT